MRNKKNEISYLDLLFVIIISIMAVITNSVYCLKNLAQGGSLPPGWCPEAVTP